MRDSWAAHEPRLATRRMRWDDVPEILRIAGRAPTPPWIRPEFLGAFQSNETVGYVALAANRIAGFALCAITYPSTGFNAGGGALLARLIDWITGKRRLRRPRLELFGLGWAEGCRRSEVERYLLDAILREFDESAESIRAVVPERSVWAQRLLRNAGFRAVRVFRGYYGPEDGYAMRRDGSRRPPMGRLKRDAGRGNLSAGGAEVRQG